MVPGLVKAGYFREVMSRPQPRDLRASDADRERVVAVLAEAAADGRLTLDEHTERVHRAYRARTLGELARLTEDLAAPSAATSCSTCARRCCRDCTPSCTPP